VARKLRQLYFCDNFVSSVPNIFVASARTHWKMAITP